MPRKGPPNKRPIAPDPIYGSEMMAMFINRLMMDGKKGTAERIFYNAMKLVEERTQLPPVEAFDKAIANAMPTVEVRPRRV
ncbi:MAG: 30S ribosomal protein S7, partial [Armatimonadota bacterium]